MSCRLSSPRVPPELCDVCGEKPATVILARHEVPFAVLSKLVKVTAAVFFCETCAVAEVVEPRDDPGPDDTNDPATWPHGAGRLGPL